MTTKTEKRITPENTSGGSEVVHELGLQRIPFPVSVDTKMRTLSARTGVTPNLLARLGFCLSLEETGNPADPFESEGEGRVINRNTLLGDYDSVYVALLRTWVERNCRGQSVDQAHFNKLFVGHMNRGFELVSARIRNLPDLANLLGRLTP